MSSILIPFRLAATEIHGNDVHLPREYQIITCYPFNDTTYYLPKLSLAPDTGSFMPGQMLYLRTYTGFEITLIPADGDTIMEEGSLTMGGGNLTVLTYLTGNDWTVLYNANGGAIMSNDAIKRLRKKQTSITSTGTPTISGSPVTGISPVPSSASSNSGSATSSAPTTPRIYNRAMTKVNVLKR